MAQIETQMLKSFAQRHHLALRRGQNLKIFFTLAINWFLWLFLQLRKSIKGIHSPIVHYYALCWNEEKMLPWMFHHYGKFVDRFTVFDNYSTDSSENIINEYQNTLIEKFSMNQGIDDNIYLHIKNNCWKNSRGKADLVVVCDMDEFLYHKDLKCVLEAICKQKISFPTMKGYEMYSLDWPSYDGTKQLPELVKVGVRSEWLDKHIIFDPHRIVDVNFDPGAHHANPTGIVKSGGADMELKVLHYKYLGLEYLLNRYKQLGNRLSNYNIENDLGTHYLAKKQELEEQFNNGLKAAKNVVD